MIKANYSATGVFDDEENEYGTQYEYKDARGNIGKIHRRGLRDANPANPTYGTNVLRNSPPSPLFLLTLIREISNSKERGGATEGGVIELYEDD